MMIELSELIGPVVRALLLTTVAILWTVLLVRIVGLRAFSKMTSFDFVATIATGSLIAQAGTRARWDEYLQAMMAIAAVFLIQWLIAKASQRFPRFRDILTNQPLLLMESGKFHDAALHESRVSRSNVMEKLRSAGITDVAQVRAVVLETTGDMSVIGGERIDDRLLEGVRRIGRAEAEG